MRARLLAAIVIASTACRAEKATTSNEYLFVWAGDSAGKASDFLAVIDAAPSSPTYASVVASLPTGETGTHPHHTEAQLGANGHLLANGFHAGRTWLYDVSAPRTPKILSAFGDLAGFSHPHSFVRLANGNVLTTFQYKADSAPASAHAHATSPASASAPMTGGLVEMDETGRVVRSVGASDPAITDRYIYPYAVLPLAGIDRAVSTTTDMNSENKPATSQWVQLWRLSDLKLLRTVALAPGPRGDEHQFTGEARLLADGKSIYVHTFNCGLYLLRGVDGDQPTSKLVHTFQGINCGVPVVVGRYWLQTVPEAHALVALDVSDPDHPREASTLKVGDDEEPHWIAVDAAGKRIVLNSAGGGTGNRLFVIDFDSTTGALKLDERFRDAGATRPGVSFNGKTWSHGLVAKAIPHGTVFSR
ncbi:MAG TPA: hypothetical protein VM076_17755 [Gemmatimonadaceae bacterium]|nr:hypothetical protein [Gemmatimonadaceae bacterium]